MLWLHACIIFHCVRRWDKIDLTCIPAEAIPGSLLINISYMILPADIRFDYLLAVPLAKTCR